GKIETKKWMIWWKDRNEKDKLKVIAKFEQLSPADFAMWLLHQSKWKDDLTNEHVFAIYTAIESYIHYHSTDDNTKTNEKQMKKKENRVIFLLCLFMVFFFFLFAFDRVSDKTNEQKFNGKNKKWVKWWSEKGEKDKAEMIEKFKVMSNKQFQTWLLNECKWKNKIKRDDIDSIRFVMDTYLVF
ncbi:hypothetical protein RFI_16063, partial [Reticulomyxa filosa]